MAAFACKDQITVIHSQEMEYGGMEVMNTHAVFGGAIADLVGRAMGHSRLDAPARHPNTKAGRSVVAANIRPWILRDGKPPELSPPNDESRIK